MTPLNGSQPPLDSGGFTGECYPMRQSALIVLAMARKSGYFSAKGFCFSFTPEESQLGHDDAEVTGFLDSSVLPQARVSFSDDTPVFNFPRKFAPLAFSRRSYGRFVPSACSKVRQISLTSAHDAYAPVHAA